MSIILSSMKWSRHYARLPDGDIAKDVDYLKDKYKMTDDDYVRFMIAMQIIGVRAYVERTGGDSYGKTI